MVRSTVLVLRWPELRPGKSHSWPGWIYLRACKVPWPLKAANRGQTDIRLRELGTKKVHMFAGERVQVDKPKGAPAWTADKIWKPKVKKVGIEKLEWRRSLA